jgi:hypothetical protein
MMLWQWRVFRRKPAPHLIGSGHRFAAENATNAKYLEREPFPKERILL